MSVVPLNAVTKSKMPVPGDAVLVERFIVARDQTAITELVRRHGPLVYGVCRRVLSDRHDVEDAFQATFLVLVRDAGRLRNQKSLASFLYGVAYRMSLRVVRQKQRRRETILVDESLVEDDTLRKLADVHAQQVLDAELSSLPERYRQTLVLRYLVGKSTEDVATELGISIGAVEGLLKRGKCELRSRLMRRGVSLGVALVAIEAMRESAMAACSESLIESTVQAGIAWKLGSTLPLAEFLSERTMELVGKEVIAMTSISKTALAVGVTLGGLAAGIGGLSMLGGLQFGTVQASGIPGRVAGSHNGKDEIRQVAKNDNLNLVDEQQGANDADGAPVQITAPPALIGVGGAGSAGPGDTTGSSGAVPGGSVGDAPPKLSTAEVGGIAAGAGGGTPGEPKSVAEQLSARTTMNLVDADLSSVLSTLKKKHNLNVRIRPPVQIANLKVNADVMDLSLQTTLQMILEPNKLDFYINNDEIVVIPLTRKTRLLPSQVDSKIRTRRELRLERVMQETTEVNFVDIPIGDAIKFLEEKNKIDIHVDLVGLSEEGTSVDTRFNLVMSGHTVKDVLEMICKPLKLDYVYENDVLLITTRDKAQTRYLESRVYRIDNKDLKTSPQALIQLLMAQTGEETDWEAQGRISALGAEAFRGQGFGFGGMGGGMMGGIGPMGGGMGGFGGGLGDPVGGIAAGGLPSGLAGGQGGGGLGGGLGGGGSLGGGGLGRRQGEAIGANVPGGGEGGSQQTGSSGSIAGGSDHANGAAPQVGYKLPDKFSLVIRQSRRVHEEIVDLLNQLKNN